MTEEKITIELTKEEQAVVDAFDKLTPVSINNVVKFMEEKYGVSAAAAVMVGGASAGGDADEGNDSVSIEIAEVGQQKIAVIKAVKDIMGVGLKEAKDLVAAVPAMVKENIPAEEAEVIKAKLEEAGATVNLK